MQNYKKSIKQIYDRAIKEQNFVYSSYDRYLNDEARKMYNSDFLQKYIDERQSKLDKINQDAAININKTLEEYMAKLGPNKEVIDSLEYQTKLNNLLTMLQLQNIKIDTKIDTSMFDFITEARDTKTMKLIQNAFHNSYLNVYVQENSVEIEEAMAKQLADGAKRAIAGGTDYNSQVAIYQMENIE